MAQGLIVKVKNNTGSILLAGKAVYTSGFDDNRQVPTIDLASADDELRLPAIGVILSDIIVGDIGTVRVNGLLGGLDTSNAEINSGVFVGTNGNLVFIDPSSIEEDGLVAQQIGTVLTKEEDGQILLFPLELRKVSLHRNTHRPGEVDDLKLTHSDLLEIDEDQHHSKLHASSHSSGESDDLNLAHSDLSGIGEDQHHLKLHASSHAAGAEDELGLSIIYSSAYVSMSLNSGLIRYLPIQGIAIASSGSEIEANLQLKMRATGKFRKMRCYVKSNTLSVDMTVRLRKNGVDGNQVITIGAAATGEFEDLINEDSYIDGDLLVYELDSPSGLGAISITLMQVENL